MSNQTIKPLGFIKSLFFYGIPGIIFFSSYHFFRIFLLSSGFSDLLSFLFCLGLPVFLLFCTAIFYYKVIEHREVTKSNFSERMRLPKFTWKDITWGLGLFICGFLGYGLFSLLTKLCFSIFIIEIPKNIAILDIPDLQITREILDKAAGGQIVGKWYLVILFV